MTEERPEDIELRTEEVQEILTQMPHWIIRAGITLIFAIIVLVLVGTWFIKYPEIISSPANVVTETPPVRLFARSSGRITLLVRDQAPVQEGQYLAIIENPANYRDVLKVKEYLFELNRGLISKNLPDEPTGLQLGDLQSTFSALSMAKAEYHFYSSDDFYSAKSDKILNQRKFYINLNEKLKSQAEILERELALAETKYQNDLELFKNGVISKQDLANSETAYLQKKYAHRSSEINLVNNQILIEEYGKSKLDLNQQNDLRRQSVISAFRESLKKMESDLLRWEQQYVIMAPVSGEVSFFKFYVNNQYVTAGEEVLTVLPESEKIVALVYVPLYGSGKIKEGQKVNLKLDSYPYKEFGVVEGRVHSISRVSRNNQYLIYVTLPQGLRTAYGKELEFKQEMGAVAEIITDDLRLFERIFNQLRSLIKNTA